MAMNIDLKEGINMIFDDKQLRNVLGYFTTGVAVMTTLNDQDEHVGVTVNSFSSVSLNPPLILFSMANSSNSTKSFDERKKFTVNILGLKQKNVATNFARPSTADWTTLNYEIGDNGCARIEDAIAHLECELFATFPGGDHIIFIGKVSRIDSNDVDDPLVYYRGKFSEIESNSRAAVG